MAKEIVKPTQITKREAIEVFKGLYGLQAVPGQFSGIIGLSSCDLKSGSLIGKIAVNMRRLSNEEKVIQLAIEMIREQHTNKVKNKMFGLVPNASEYIYEEKTSKDKEDLSRKEKELFDSKCEEKILHINALELLKIPNLPKGFSNTLYLLYPILNNFEEAIEVLEKQEEEQKVKELNEEIKKLKKQAEAEEESKKKEKDVK